MLLKFRLTKHMHQWDTKKTLYVMLPATTEGEIIKEDELSEVRFELYPGLIFLLEESMMEKIDG